MLDIKELVRGNKQVTFIYYRDGDLWYRHEDGLEFPVPIADAGGATMLATDKAILFMRHMRKHAAMLERGKMDDENSVP